jgi:alpha-amylase
MGNGIMLQGFEWYLSDDGNYYNMMKKRVTELKKTGFSAVWIPPVFKATSKSDVGYGIYDMYDLGEFDQKGSIRTKYGTKQELIEMIRTFHNEGIQVYADVVMNHKAGGDGTEKFIAVKVDWNDRLKELETPKEIEAWTLFDFPVRNGKYSDFKWNFNHFSGVDYDNINKDKAIFRIVGENKGWNLGVSNERGNYDYLMFADINHAHPEVREDFKRWAEWFVSEIEVDGFRFDAVKHIDTDFIKDFKTNVRKKFGSDFYFVGEYWMDSIEAQEEYLKNTDFDIDIFDVGLHYNFHEASVKGDSYDLRTVFDNTVVAKYPNEAVTFVDNHDSQLGQSLQSWVEPWFKEMAYALILLRKAGYPCVFYGDYYGTGGDNSFDGMKDLIDKLIYLRQNYCFGYEDNYFENRNLIGWSRKGTEENGVNAAVVMSNKEYGKIKMYMGEFYRGKIYRDYLCHDESQVVIDDGGYGEFPVQGGSLSVWICQ